LFRVFRVFRGELSSEVSSVLTGRGWWCLFLVVLMLLVGVGRGLTPLTLTGLALLLWLGWEWLSFAVRARTVVRRLGVERSVGDERGPVHTLWAGRSFEVRVALRLRGPGRLPHAVIADAVPFGIVYQDGEPRSAGAVSAGRPLALRYRIHCPRAGLARFEGLRVEVADLQGFFYHLTFLRAPVVLRVLPGLTADHRGPTPTVKRHNQLPPPGMHRLYRPGSGSELLDLRDYQPGDPPRTIAWKVSARRDKLITKEFESEVPVRCTLFLDTSRSVLVPAALPAEPPPDARGRRRPAEPAAAPPLRAIDRLVAIAAGVLQANAAIRDLTGLCLFDERGTRIVRPDRVASHHNDLLRLLADAAGQEPIVPGADPDALLPAAHALAREVYPDLLRAEVNAMPAWLVWLVGFPGYRRRWRGFIDWLHRRKRRVLFLGTTIVPLGLLLLNLLALIFGAPLWTQEVLVQALVFLSPLAFLAAWALFLFSLLASARPRRLARWRKRLAALLAVRQRLGPGALPALLEDDDAFALQLQQFLAEHQVPYAVPLYDEAGRYLPAAPGKVDVLARALLQAVGRGRDNELFVLLADLLELDDHLGPLLHAVRVALARHHQVVLICPWPPGLPLSGEEGAERPAQGPEDAVLRDLLARVTAARFHAAYARVRRTFARLGVAVVCAASEEPVPLILDRMDRLRCVGGRR
jgi:uncharacterized protein (DUF58 family)